MDGVYSSEMPEARATSGRLLDEVVAAYRRNPAIAQKQQIGLVTRVLGETDWLSGPGDDAAVTSVDGRFVLSAGEAMWPPFVEQDPYGAGIGAVVANVNDIAAMGGRCLGIVDTIVGPEPLAREVLRGLSFAAERYDVPILGGHLTIRDGPAALSAFATGMADVVLASRNAAPGHVLLFAGCLDGEIRTDFPFLPSFRSRGARLAGDLALLPALAESGDCVAAKDISMAGVLGSLAMLLEPSGCGATVDLDVLPRPSGVGLAAWVDVFPSYGFLLCAAADRVDAVVDRFHPRGLSCAPIGTLDDTGVIRVRAGTDEQPLTPVRGITGITGITGIDSAPRPES